jgi:prophage regulatory protein
MKRLLRLPAVLDRTGMRKTQLLEAVRDGRFPKRVAPLEGGRAVAWVEDEVEAYIASRIAARDQTTPAPTSKTRRRVAA